MCVCARETVCGYVCVCARERERQCVCVGGEGGGVNATKRATHTLGVCDEGRLRAGGRTSELCF